MLIKLRSISMQHDPPMFPNVNFIDSLKMSSLISNRRILNWLLFRLWCRADTPPLYLCMCIVLLNILLVFDQSVGADHFKRLLFNTLTSKRCDHECLLLWEVFDTSNTVTSSLDNYWLIIVFLSHFKMRLTQVHLLLISRQKENPNAKTQ